MMMTSKQASSNRFRSIEEGGGEGGRGEVYKILFIITRTRSFFFFFSQ